ncbi:MAG: Uncharacterized protein Athens101426_589 [Parcubacteria group bacterium Athens1014_26]|nr:MAG: Uncharacterized protein Athens101426_589 [Parcubacteria group bacterium Athens1014_26]
MRGEKFLKILTYLSVIFLSYFILTSARAAATPEFIVSWKAKTLVPAEYTGKIFPIKNSLVEVGFDLLDNNKIIDLSKYTVSWYLEGDFIKSGAGLKSFIFTTNKANENDQLLRVTVAGYKGADLDKFITIPLASPEAVINYKSPLTNEINIGAHEFTALPYFFNASSLNNLSFNWKVNGEAPQNTANKSTILNLNLESQGTPTQTPLNISLSIQNILNALESATKSLNFMIK